MMNMWGRSSPTCIERVIHTYILYCIQHAIDLNRSLIYLQGCHGWRMYSSSCSSPASFVMCDAWGCVKTHHVVRVNGRLDVLISNCSNPTCTIRVCLTTWCMHRRQKKQMPLRFSDEVSMYMQQSTNVTFLRPFHLDLGTSSCFLRRKRFDKASLWMNEQKNG